MGELGSYSDLVQQVAPPDCHSKVLLPPTIIPFTERLTKKALPKYFDENEQSRHKSKRSPGPFSGDANSQWIRCGVH